MKILTAPLGTFLILLLTGYSLFGQVDTVFKTNGETLQGKVVEVGVDEIKFTYENETMVNVLALEGIEKIRFASGREQVFAAQDERSEIKTLPIKNNSVAVLPIEVYENQILANPGETVRIQKEVIAALQKQAPGFYYLGSSEVNGLLKENGITDLGALNDSELFGILGTDHVVMTTITIDQKGFVSYSNSNESKSKGIISGKEIKNTTTTTSGREQYKTFVTMVISKNGQGTIYDKNREALLTYPDAYKGAVKWLIKRSPLVK